MGVSKTRVGAGVLAVAGLVVGLWAGGPLTRPTQAQAPAAVPAAVAGRYQLSSFVLDRQGTPGAYVLDTQTGDVFQVVGKTAPERVGSVADARPKK